MTADKLTYEELKELAKEQGKRVTDLLALAPQNDPYYSGTPATLEAARWFADLWRRFGYSNGVHLRRVHYQVISQGDMTKPNGEPYENTEGDWNFLCGAGKQARYLGLVDPEAFVDRRNPEPHVFAWGGWGHTLDFAINAPDWSLPRIDAELAGNVDFGLPRPSVSGYDYDASDQPYHVELWVEKSTMDDVLLPIGQELGVNVVTSLGFQSITGVIALIQRIARAGKPARVFYISDFDPAGDSMPVGVARQLEYWLTDYAAGADVALTPIVLTRDQVEAYRLPRVPVKDTDRRKASFEERYGTGAVELDALEALYPGELAGIVRAAVAPYRDLGLARRLARAEAQAQQRVNQAWEDATWQYEDDLQDLAAEAKTLLASYEERLAALSDELDAELAPLRDRLEELRQAVSNEADGLEVDLPERPEPETEEADEEDWLFKSDRTYLDQMAVYKARKLGAGDPTD